MYPQYCIEAVDRNRRAIMKNLTAPFRGKSFCLAVTFGKFYLFFPKVLVA